MRSYLGVVTILVSVLATGQALADDRVDYLRQVKPILTARCYACHGALQKKGGLRADTAAALREGGESGPAVVAGEIEESELLSRVTAPGSERMPPPSDGEALKANEIALLKRWVEQGADAPSDEKPEADPRDHWAFRAPVRPEVPPLSETAKTAILKGSVGNPIDAFLAVEWEKRGLKPQPRADKGLLLRRVYLDLIGVPPTDQEREAFEADQAPDAYEKVADRLLASKQYGERWGRHWMDVWRYSDWWGLGADLRNSQKHIWHWRDWIIESLNADKGYDQMVREMLAADELYPNDLDKLRATGFLARHYFKFNRNTWLEETVEHTGKAFLGLTLNCAKCHDHKYDPISQQDYYRFRAFFEPYQVRTDEVPGEVDFEKDGLPRVFDCNLEAPTYCFVRGNESQPIKDRPLKPGLPPLLALGELKIEPVSLPPEASLPGLRPFVLENHLRGADAKIVEAKAALEKAKAKLAEVERPSTTAPASDAGSQLAETLIHDDFASPQPDTWEMVSGQWRYQDGKLLQEHGDEMRYTLRSKRTPPSDFEATLRFTLTGGEPWRSVGLCFDVAGGREVLVYLSAYAGGPKLQLAYEQGAGYVYPPEGARGWNVRVGETYAMTVRVRGTLVNVAVNGEHALAYRLPFARNAGALTVITYAASAAFSGFELKSLPSGFTLVDAANGGPPGPSLVERAKAELALAEKSLAAASVQPDLIRARAAADRARSQQPPDTKAKELAIIAARREREAAVAKAEEDLTRAELALLKADAPHKEAERGKRDTAKTALATAKKALESPGEEYTPLRGSLKSVESNVETEASRTKPYPTTSTGRRSALASWITDRRHPLTARVAINHIWVRHFGKPLVPTIFDLGRKGTPPTHAALLDWLAVELVERQWSMKHLHRLIVTSEAYRRTSASTGADPATLTADPENRWYWRMNPVRMEAQVVRDSLLQLAGVLDPKMGGPPLPAAEEASPRRSLYFTHSHNEHQKFLNIFDDASVLECYRRSESIVPVQALALSNSRFSLTMAAKISTRLHDRLGNASDAEFARSAFLTILDIAPSPEEQAACEQTLADLTALLKTNGAADPVRRARNNLVQALLNHNDFITIR